MSLLETVPFFSMSILSKNFMNLMLSVYKTALLPVSNISISVKTADLQSTQLNRQDDMELQNLLSCNLCGVSRINFNNF